MPSRLVLPVAAALALALAPFTGADATAAPRKQARIDVTGVYDSNYGEVRLVQRGSLVEGEYVCCGGGRIEGRIDGTVIEYYWVEAERRADGHGVWRVFGAGRELVGTWGSDDSDDDGGEWNLQRADEIAN
jgi:hypothetical protein